MKFRQKYFSKTKGIIKYIKDHPVLPISAASLGIGVANYATNTRRTKEAKEFNRAQLNAMKTLNKNISDNNKTNNLLREALIENSKKLSENSAKVLDHREREGRTSNKSKKSFLSTIFRRKKEKDFSIQSGGFKGRKVEPSGGGYLTGTAVGAGLGAVVGIGLSHPSNPRSFTGAVATVGALLGAGVGALVTWLSNTAEKSIFNSGLSHRANSYTVIKGLENYYTPKEKDSVVEEEVTQQYGNIKHTVRTSAKPKKSLVSPIGTLFSVDSDPKKHTVNLLLRCNVLAMLIIKPTNMELTKLNNALDSYCKSFKAADYTSQKIDKDCYLVELKVVNGAEINPLIDIINSGIKINILTTDRFGIKNK